MFKPLHKMTQAEKDEIARKFDNLYKRPDTSDWAWWNSIQEDCDKRQSKPISDDTVFQHSLVLITRG